MDGVMADTAPYHLGAWREVFQKRGVSLSEADFRRTFGQRNDTIIRENLGGEVSRPEMEAIAHTKEEIFRRSLDKLEPMPGVIGLMRLLREHGCKMALASSAPMENIRLVIRALGVGDCFEAIICDQDVAEGKPSPQVFQLAARRLGVEPGDCIVIEDAVAGVSAARRAGMHCLALTATHPRHRLKEADLVVDTLEGVSLSDLEGLFKPPQN